MRPPDKRTPARGGRRDLSWRMDQLPDYCSPPQNATLPPLLAKHLGASFWHGWMAGRAAQ